MFSDVGGWGGSAGPGQGPRARCTVANHPPPQNRAEAGVVEVAASQGPSVVGASAACGGAASLCASYRAVGLPGAKAVICDGGTAHNGTLRASASR